MGLKAMNCPGHMLVFGSEVRSYKDLPLRLHEQTPLHRNEASGRPLRSDARTPVLAGRCALLRDRSRRSASEVEQLLRLVQRVYGDFGLDYKVKLSTRPEQIPRSNRDVGSRRGIVEGSARRGRPGLHDQRRRRSFLRSEARFRRHRRHRPHVAVRDDSARLPAARSAST
ncbi:MAG: hypothetical protein QM736_05655 [Vicinamibacterales bacterium]